MSKHRTTWSFEEHSEKMEHNHESQSQNQQTAATNAHANGPSQPGSNPVNHPSRRKRVFSYLLKKMEPFQESESQNQQNNSQTTAAKADANEPNQPGSNPAQGNPPSGRRRRARRFVLRLLKKVGHE